MNRVTVTIAERQYTLLTEEDAEFTQKVAQHLNGELSELLEGGRMSLVDACILGGLNITESYFKEQESLENLRRQLKEYLEESTKLKLELSEAKREISALKGKQQG